MSDVTANIHINVDSSSAAQNLKNLESQINQFQRSVAQSNSAAAASQQSLNKALVDGINNTGLFSAKMVPLTSSIESFTKALDNNKLSLGQYTKYAASQLPGMSKVFQSEFDTMERVATDRVKKIQSRYVELGNSAKSVQQAIQITPNNLAQGYSTDLAVAAQKQQIFNKLIDDGSTKLLNWGKNTQWAGRQLMVGFTLPLAAFGTLAAKTFMDLDKQARDFKRVYGDALTPPSEVAKNLEAVRGLASEYTKYGISVKDTMQVASTAAAAGMQNDKLIDNTKESLRLATIGQIDYQQALTTTITLQNAFNVSNKDLGASVDFIGAVANQTVLSVDDLTNAIPRVAPVIQGLGGDVKDLAVMLVALREGGVSAEQGANALKSGLASLINPTASASAALSKYGVDLDAMIKNNKGNILGLVQDFGAALSKMDDFSRQQVLEKVFGKYQFARIGALFDNINEKTGQTANAMQLLGASTQDLANMSQKSLDQISGSTTAKFQASLENLKVSIAPIGEAFLKGITPIVDVVSKIADAFNNLPAPVKNAVAVIAGVVAGLGPIILMTIGLVANGFANIVKGIQLFRKILSGIKGDSDQFKYLSTAELEAKTASDALEGSSRKLTESLLLQKGAVAGLVAEYQRYVGAAGLAANVGGMRGARPPLRRATGGTVPGSGNGDTVPALLTPGETIVTKKASQKYAPVIAAMNSGTLQGFEYGLNPDDLQLPMTSKTKNSSQFKNLNQSLVRFLQAVDNGEELQRQIEARLADQARIKTLTAKDIQDAVNAVVEPHGGHISMRGSRPEEGAGITSSDYFIQRQTEQFATDPRLIAEREHLRSQIQGTGLTSKQEARVTGVVASHVQPAQPGAGKFDDPTILNPELDAINGYVERIKRSSATWSKNDIVRNKLMEAFNGNIDQVNTEIDRFTRGLPPLTRESHMAYQAFAELDIEASAAASSLNGNAVGTGTRHRNGTYSHTAIGTKPGTVGSQAVPASILTGYRLNNPESTYFAEGGGNVRYSARTSDRGPSQARQQANVDAQEYEKTRESKLHGHDPYLEATDRNSPHPKAPKDGRDDAIAYMKARNSQLSERTADLRSQTMTPQGAYGATQSAQRRELYNIQRMQELGMSETQIQRALIAAKERELRSLQTQLRNQQQSTALAEEAAIVNGEQVISERMGLSAKMKGGLGKVGKGVMGKAGMLGAGLGMASMIPFMAQDENGKFMGMDANTIGTGMMGGGMALEGVAMGSKMFAAGGILAEGGALAGVGAAAAAAAIPLAAFAAVAAVGVIAFKIWRNNVDDAAKAAGDLGANLGGTANALTGINKILGKSAPAQRQTQLQLGMNDAQTSALGEWQATFESGAGKDFIDGLKTATSEERFKKLNDYVKEGVASGALDKETATSFANAVAIQLNDAVTGNRVKAGISGMGTGSQALLGYANQRASAVNPTMNGMQEIFANNAINSAQVSKVMSQTAPGMHGRSNPQMLAAMQGLNKRQTIGSDQSAKIVGGSMQTVSEYASALALANEEFAKGTISATQYVNISKQANDGIAKYTKAMQDAIYASDDLGGTMSSLKDQLIKTGLSEEDAVKITELKGNVEISTSKIMSEAISALSQGMDVNTISAITDYATNAKNKGTAAANAFTNASYGGQAMALSGLAQNAQTGGIEGITGGNIQKMVDVAFKFTQEGGTVGDYYNMIMSLPKEVRVNINSELTGMDSKEVKDYVDAINKINKSVGADNLSKIMGSDQFKKTTTKQKTAIASSTETLSKNLGGDQASIDKYINLVLKETPDGLTKDLPIINKNLEALNQIPPDMQKLLRINLSDPDMVAKIGPYADDLKTLGDVISGLPTEKQELGASLAYDINGKPKDPAKFLSDFQKIEDHMGKLKSNNISVKKKAMYEILTIQNGKPANQESLDSAEKSLEKKFGPGIVKKLPPDVYEKSMRLLYNAEELKKQATALRKAAGMSSGDIAAELNKEAAALEALAGTNTSEAYTAAATGAGKTVGSGTGGGGGGGTDPFKDFKSSIANQIQKYADAGATVKNLMSAKFNFMKLLKSNKGLDDKVRQSGLTPALQEYIMGLDPKDANKVLAKITGKNGKLNKSGIALQDRYIAGQIKQTTSEAQTSLIQTRMQGVVARDLSKRGFLNNPETNKIAMDQIAGDPKKAEQYYALLKKAESGTKGAKEELDKFTNSIISSAKATEDFSQISAAMADPAQFAIDNLNKDIDVLQTHIQEITDTLTTQSEAAFEASFGKTKDQADLIIKKNQQQIDIYQQQIDKLQEKNSLAQHEIDLLDHSKKQYQDQIDAIQKIIDGYQQQIDQIQHQVDLRNHSSELINHQLDLMSRQEKNISDAYDKRMEALNQISSINQHLIDQQKQQLGLAQAFNQGDIYAAAQAANDMQGSSAQYASDQMKNSLDQGKTNAINGLTSENGMTRIQLEEQLQNISDQNFQSQQQIWDLNQKIYANQQNMLPLKKSISDIDASIATYSETIWKTNQSIYDIQTNSIGPLQTANKEWSNRLNLSASNLEISIKEATLTESAQIDSLKRTVDHLAATNAAKQAASGLRKEWQAVAEQIKNANDLLKNRTGDVLQGKDIPDAVYDSNGKIDVKATIAALGAQYQAEIDKIIKNAPQMLTVGKYAGGMIGRYANGGHVGMDSVPAMLTPGEFVMRKDAVDKYGATMLSSMNMGAFELPKYKVSGTTQNVNGSASPIKSINAPVYNTYSVNIPVTHPGASADEIAHVVMTKIRNVDNSSIRRINAY
jgi:TP901 family phage tail tape measure protein